MYAQIIEIKDRKKPYNEIKDFLVEEEQRIGCGIFIEEGQIRATEKLRQET